MTDFRIRVIIDPASAGRGAKRVGASLDGLQSKANRLRTAFIGAFAVLGTGVGIGASIRLLADFGQEMSTVQAITQATGQQFALLRQEAQDLGNTTRFSATQAAEGMTFLARAGFDAGQVLQSVGDTLLLAQAGALDLGRAADIASNILTGFRLNAAEAGRVVDVLALAANSSNTNVAQLGDAMKLVAPVAAGLGVSLEEATAAVGALSDAGLQGTLAGTGLRRVLSELESPTSKTIGILRDLGLQADDVAISQVGLTQALNTLAEAGVDTGLALEIFGDRGGPAFEVLSSSIPKVEALNEALLKADGTAQRIADTMDQNLNGALLSVRSAIEGFFIALGDSGSADALEGSLRSIAEGIRELTKNMDDIIPVIEAVAIAIGVLLVAKILAAVATLKAATLALSVTPWFALAAAIAFVSFTLIDFATNTGPAAAGIGLIAREATTTAKALRDLADLRLDIVDNRETMNDVELIANLSKEIVSLRDLAGDLRGLELAPRSLERIAPDVDLSGLEQITRGNLTLFSADATQEAIEEQIAIIEKSLAAARDRLAAVRSDTESTNRAKNALDEFFVSLQREQQLVGETAKEQEILKAQFEATSIAVEAGDEALQNLPNTLAAVRNEIEFLQAAAAGAEVQNLIQDLRDQNEALSVESTALNESRLAREQALAVLQAERIVREGGTNLTETEIQQIKDLVAANFELKTAIQDKNQALREGDEATVTRQQAFQNQLAGLNQEIELLGKSAEERRIAAEIERIEVDLKQQLGDKNFTLTETERELLAARLANVEAVKGEAAVLEEIQGPLDALIAKKERLIELNNQGKISNDQLATGLRDVNIAMLEMETNAAAGVERGLLKIQKQAEDLASVSEAVLVNAFNNLEDALVEFATTGEFNFSGLVDSILADIARLLARQAILAVINALSGGAGGAVGSILTTVLAADGAENTRPGQPFIVGEEGPELFVPSNRGDIIPTEQTAAMMGAAAPTVVQAPAPQVNVSVVNVSDPNEAISAMDSPDGDQVILNALQRNRNAAKRSLS